MNIVVFDTETGGLNPLTNALLSIGAVAYSVENGSWVELSSFYVQIHAEDRLVCDKRALEINGLDPSRGTMEFSAIVDFAGWLETIGQHWIAGQNVSFDEAFVKAAAERHGIHLGLDYHRLDLASLAIAKSLSGEEHLTSFSLNSIAKLHGMSRSSSTHNALEDARVTAHLLQIYVGGVNG